MALTLVRCRRYNRRTVGERTVRVSRIAIGLGLVVIGVVLALPFVPGPGLPLIFGGLTVLGGEFEWARRLRDRMHDTARRAMRRANGG
jgi:hypothetical protein